MGEIPGETKGFMENNALLSLSNCHFSPIMHPWLPGSVWEKEREREREKDEEVGEAGEGRRSLEGVYCWKKPVDLSAGIYSPHTPPLL